MFVHLGGHQDGVSELFLKDALARLTPQEKKLYSSQAGGFLFRGNKVTCIVIVTFRKDVIMESSSPAFCYDSATNKFVERL